MRVIALFLASLSGCRCTPDQHDAPDDGPGAVMLPVGRIELPPPLRRLVEEHTEAGWELEVRPVVLGDRDLHSDVHLVCSDCPETCSSIHLGPYSTDGRPIDEEPDGGSLTVAFDPATSTVAVHLEQVWDAPVGVVFWPEDWALDAVTLDGEPAGHARIHHDLLVPGPGRIEMTGGGPASSTMQVDGAQVLAAAWSLPGTGRAPMRITTAPIGGMTWESPMELAVDADARDILVARPRPSPPRRIGHFRVHDGPVDAERLFDELTLNAADALTALQEAGVPTDTIDVRFWSGGPSFAYADGVVLAPWALQHPHVVIHELGHHLFRGEVPPALQRAPDATLLEAAATWLALREDREARSAERSRIVEPGCYGLRSVPLDSSKHTAGGAILLDMLAARIGRDALQRHLVTASGWADLMSRLELREADWLHTWLSTPAWPRPEIVDGFLVDRAATGLTGEVEIRWDTGATQRVALGSSLQPPPGAVSAEIDPELRFLSGPTSSP